jgi:hypothetical protein
VSAEGWQGEVHEENLPDEGWCGRDEGVTEQLKYVY